MPAKWTVAAWQVRPQGAAGGGPPIPETPMGCAVSAPVLSYSGMVLALHEGGGRTSTEGL